MRLHQPRSRRTGACPQLTKRPLALAIAALASQGATAAVLPVSLSNVTVSSGHSYNSGAAVCAVNESTGVDVSAKVSAGFTAESTSATTLGKCTQQKSGSTTLYYFKPGNYTETKVATTGPDVTADDGNSLASLSGGPVFTGNLTSPATDDKYGVTVEATASETVTVTPFTFERRYDATDTTCSGSATDTAPTAGKATVTENKGSDSDDSAYYYVDLEAPTQTHNVTNAGQSVQQLTNLNLNIHTAGGSSEETYKQRAGYNDGSTDVWGAEVESQFGKSLADGIAPQKTEAAAVLVSCSVPVGTDYVSKAQLTSTNDLCGGAYAPPAIDSTAQGKGDAGLFDVTANSECAATNQAVITAPLPPANLLDDPDSNASSYALVACYTAQAAGPAKARKVVSYPGTVHLGTVFNSSGDGSSCDDPVAIGNIVFTVDSDFDFLKTGNSPSAHVFAGVADDSIGWPLGAGPGFWYHTGYPLVEIDPALISISQDGDELTISLGDTELGCGAGLLPKGKTLYARAHAKFMGPLSAAGTEHQFMTSVAGLQSSATLVENPLESCVDGQIPIPPP